MVWRSGFPKCAPAPDVRGATIEECAKEARAIALQMINELAKPWETREIEDDRLIYGHKIADIIEANIRALSRPHHQEGGK